MNYPIRLIPLLRMFLLTCVVATGFVSIVATGDDEPCLDVGEACTSDSECCHNHCEEGRCCRGIGADLASDDPPSVCCSGAIRRDPVTGPYCCGTEGMVVSSEDRCCDGLSWVPLTGVCTRCPPPATGRQGQRCWIPIRNACAPMGTVSLRIHCHRHAPSATILRSRTAGSIRFTTRATLVRT
jgi:hypothetical protein